MSLNGCLISARQRTRKSIVEEAMKREETFLEKPIRELYHTFSVYPRFQEIKECTHCISSDKQEAMRPLPLHLLSVEQLWTFAWNMSCLTWGDTNDFKHFLPRL